MLCFFSNQHFIGLISRTTPPIWTLLANSRLGQNRLHHFDEGGLASGPGGSPAEPCPEAHQIDGHRHGNVL